MRRLLLGTALTFALMACAKDQGEAGTSEQQSESPSAQATPAGGGSITGTVSFTGTPPENPAIDMSEEPKCRDKHSGQPRQPDVVVNGGKLANVVVYVKSGLPNQQWPVPRDTAVLDQEGCIYEPRHFAVMAGQQIEIKNSDPVLHNIKAVPTKNRGFNISQPREGMESTRTFPTAEDDVPLECNVHGWMKANLMVLPHPFFATTGPDGSFTIRGLPAGTYQVEAHHQKLGARTATVTVPADGSAQATFTFGAATT